MGLRRMSLPSLMLGLVLVISVVRLAEAQSGSADCASNLVACADYLNSTKPPDSCCKPLKQTVETQLQCLCNLFNSGILKQLNIDVNQALQLSRNCGITQGIESCKVAGAPSPSSSSVPPPPATPGGDNTGSGAGRVAFTGLSFLFLFWASMLFN